MGASKNRVSEGKSVNWLAPVRGSQWEGVRIESVGGIQLEESVHWLVVNVLRFGKMW